MCFRCVWLLDFVAFMRSSTLTGYLRNATSGLCTACPIGSFYVSGTTTQNATCILCAPGSISNLAGSLTCTRMFLFNDHMCFSLYTLYLYCNVFLEFRGFYSACLENMFSGTPGASVCQICSPHASSSANAAECLCDAGFFGE